jgi:hypothetical protein
MALEGIGVWRLEIHGWNGAQELLGASEVLRSMQNRGAMVPARLILEQRQSKRDGKTFNYAVPVLDLEFNVAEALGSPGERQYVTPVPRISSAETTESQILAVANNERLAAIESRSRSQVLPPTGLRPRTASEVDHRSVPEQGVNASPSNLAVSPSIRKVLAIMKGTAGIPSDETGRLLWISAALNREVQGLADLTDEDAQKITDKVKAQQTMSAAKPQSEQYKPNEEPF